jgi:hypothetical protein
MNITNRLFMLYLALLGPHRYTPRTPKYNSTSAPIYRAACWQPPDLFVLMGHEALCLTPTLVLLMLHAIDRRFFKKGLCSTILHCTDLPLYCLQPFSRITVTVRARNRL